MHLVTVCYLTDFITVTKLSHCFVDARGLAYSLSLITLTLWKCVSAHVLAITEAPLAVNKSVNT